jgi:hypothetical protein
MNIIIFGGSGRTGAELIRQSLKQGHRVTVFTRKQLKRSHIEDENLTVVKGDLNNMEAVRAAMVGKNAVISALGVSKTLHHDPEVVKGVATIVKAMKAENIKRCIYLSVFLAQSKPGQFSFFVNNVLKRIIGKEVRDHELKETLIRDHVKEYVIVRAVRLTDEPATGNYRHGENIAIKKFLPSITRADVAHFMLQQLVNPTYMNKAVLITGN